VRQQRAVADLCAWALGAKGQAQRVALTEARLAALPEAHRMVLRFAYRTCAAADGSAPWRDVFAWIAEGVLMVRRGVPKPQRERMGQRALEAAELAFAESARN